MFTDHVYVHVYVCVLMCVHAYLCMCVHASMCMCVSVVCACVCMRALMFCVHACLCVCTVAVKKKGYVPTLLNDRSTTERNRL